jgi:hypothetical protein
VDDKSVQQFYSEMEILANACAAAAPPPRRAAAPRPRRAHPPAPRVCASPLTRLMARAGGRRHDNIVRFLGGCVQPDSLCILLEFCPRSLYDYLRQAQTALPLKQVLCPAHDHALRRPGR